MQTSMWLSSPLSWAPELCAFDTARTTHELAPPAMPLPANDQGCIQLGSDNTRHVNTMGLHRPGLRRGFDTREVIQR
jgi:hypothetical protein